MEIVEQQVRLEPIDRAEILTKLEMIGRISHKSEHRITEDSARGFIRRLIKAGHESVLEHISVTAFIRTNRAIQQELTRHRLASYTVESTRYVSYDDIKIIPSDDLAQDEYWHEMNEPTLDDIQGLYEHTLKTYSREVARDFLPLCTASDLYMTANLRTWRHVLQLRLVGITGRPHPQMVLLMKLLLEEFQLQLPEIVEDLI